MTFCPTIITTELKKGEMHYEDMRETFPEEKNIGFKYEEYNIRRGMITDDSKRDEARIQTGHLKKSMISLQRI